VDRVFLDANVLFSSAYSRENGLLELWSLKTATLCTSRYALEEARFNLELESQKERLNALTQKLEIVDTAIEKLPRGIHLPEKDAPILLGALQAKATHLLTGDAKHFGAYYGKSIAGVLILRPADYLRKRAKE